jgi:hypothetical protein
VRIYFVFNLICVDEIFLPHDKIHRSKNNEGLQNVSDYGTATCLLLTLPKKLNSTKQKWRFKIVTKWVNKEESTFFMSIVQVPSSFDRASRHLRVFKMTWRENSSVLGRWAKILGCISVTTFLKIWRIRSTGAQALSYAQV